MKITKRTIVSAVEYYLCHPEKLANLELKLKKLFWAQREWHPVVNMNWVSGITSNGFGQLTYPDGTIGHYEVPIRAD